MLLHYLLLLLVGQAIIHPYWAQRQQVEEVQHPYM
jgi:hypothetical protein